MKPTWAEAQLLYCRRLGVLRTLKPGAFRVYDALLQLSESGVDTGFLPDVTIAQIGKAAGVSRSVVVRATAELLQLQLLDRFTDAKNTTNGAAYVVRDLQWRFDTLQLPRRRGTRPNNGPGADLPTTNTEA